jgi:hypothetical protein
MAIGTLAAIGLGLGGVGAVASSSAQKNAAKRAQDASNYAADQSAAVLRENYNKSAQALAPWQRSGLQANDAINALLGLGGPEPMQGLPTTQPNAMSQFMGGDFGGYTTPAAMMGDYGNWQPPGGWQGFGGFGVQNFGPTAMGNVTTPAPSAQQRYENAFNNFRNSTGYNFRLNEGINAINSGYAGAGSIKSGAAMKAINDYGQNMASGEFANYLAALGNQQAIGSNAASAQAGVSQNLGNSLANIAMQQGNNNANAALARGSSGFGNAASLIGGGLFRLGM